MEILKSTPNIEEFRPLPQQLEIIKDVRKNFDYSKGTHELLLSGSVGSAKSLTLAHLAVTHALMYPKARVGLGRLALPQLKATLCNKIQEHLFESGIPYKYHESTGNFELTGNGSELRAVSWADGNLAKLGSLEFSAFVIEELTETKTSRPYDVILQRVNRLPHIREPFVASATNPDAPSHWVYKKLVANDSDKVKVYYSNTFDNPYLPASYIESLKERLDERMARRMLYGEWLEVYTEVVYFSYTSENFVKSEYKVDTKYPIRLSWDFNIGQGKPLSLVLMQYITEKDQWHIFDEVIVDGQRTLDSLEEAAARGLLDFPTRYIIHGDASGKNNDTRSFGSDYTIIEKFLDNYQNNRGQKIIYTRDIPSKNPPIRERHNAMNSYIKNANGEKKLFVYKKAPTCDEGLRLTKLKSRGQFLEDDKDRYQHCTTAIGYAVMVEHRRRMYNSTNTFSQGRY